MLIRIFPNVMVKMEKSKSMSSIHLAAWTKPTFGGVQKVNRYFLFCFCFYYSENASDLAVDRMEPAVHVANRAFPSVADIYPEIGTDLTQVTWAHGVDTRKKLERALRGKHFCNCTESGVYLKLQKK